MEAASEAWSLRCKLKNSKKKARDGQLSFVGVGATATLRFDWSPQSAAARPQFKLPVASITDQMVSKGEDKAMMKVVTADTSQICVLQFHSRQDQQATLTRLLELRALSATPAVPLVVLSGVERGKYLAQDKELRDQYQELVAQGALRDEDFWKDEQLQERLALERAESGTAALPVCAPGQASKQVTARIGSGNDAVATQKPMLVDKEMSEHIFCTQPCVYASFKAAVLTGRVSEADFWADYLQTKQQMRERAAAPNTEDVSRQSVVHDTSDDSGAHLLGILRSAALQEKALHERRVASGELQSAASRQAADESRPGAIGMRASVSERHAVSAAATTVENIANVFETPATAGAREAEKHIRTDQWGQQLAQSRADISSEIMMDVSKAGNKRGFPAYNKVGMTSGTEGTSGIGGLCKEDGDDDEEDDAWCAEVSNWEPCSVAAYRAKRRRLISQSQTALTGGESSSSRDNALVSFTLGGGAPYGIRVPGEEEASRSAKNATPLAERCDLNPFALSRLHLYSQQSRSENADDCGVDARYTSELKACFGRSLQYLRHFWLAVNRGDSAKARRMHIALRQLYDTIETQNRQLGAEQRASLAPMSHHLQQEMLRTALASLPTDGQDG